MPQVPAYVPPPPPVVINPPVDPQPIAPRPRPVPPQNVVR